MLSTPRQRHRAASRSNHPTARVKPDGRGPQRRRRQYSPLYALLLLLGFGMSLYGLVMVLSASSSGALGGGDPWHWFRRQALWLGAGFVVAFITSRIDYRLWRERAVAPLMGLSIVLLVAVFIPGIGINVLGSSRWVGWGSFTFQPSELAKFALIVWAADLLSRPQRSVTDLHQTVYPLLGVTCVFSALLLVEPDLGTAVLVVGIILVMLYAAGGALHHLGIITASAGAAAGILAYAASYRRRRLFAFSDPWADPIDVGYQTVQAGVSIANGGITGVGLGAARGKWGYVPLAHSDFIFAIVAEEFGLVGGIAVVGCFLAIGMLGYLVAHRIRQSDPFGAFLAIGITSWIVMQAFINIGAVIGVLPITGVTLPFLSAGGSSLVVTMAAYGVLLNIASHADG